MSDKWTAGPWCVNKKREIVQLHERDSNVHYVIAGAGGVGYTDEGKAEVAANARLIAQAPAMAALLRELIYSANGHELPIPLALKLQEAKQLLKDLEGS